MATLGLVHLRTVLTARGATINGRSGYWPQYSSSALICSSLDSEHRARRTNLLLIRLPLHIVNIAVNRIQLTAGGYLRRASRTARGVCVETPEAWTACQASNRSSDDRSGGDRFLLQSTPPLFAALVASLYSDLRRSAGPATTREGSSSGIFGNWLVGTERCC